MGRMKELAYTIEEARKLLIRGGIPMPRPDDLEDYEPHDDPSYDSRDDLVDEDEPPTELME